MIQIKFILWFFGFKTSQDNNFWTKNKTFHHEKSRRPFIYIIIAVFNTAGHGRMILITEVMDLR